MGVGAHLTVPGEIGIAIVSWVEAGLLLHTAQFSEWPSPQILFCLLMSLVLSLRIMCLDPGDSLGRELTQCILSGASHATLSSSFDRGNPGLCIGKEEMP